MNDLDNLPRELLELLTEYEMHCLLARLKEGRTAEGVIEHESGVYTINFQERHIPLLQRLLADKSLKNSKGFTYSKEFWRGFGKIVYLTMEMHSGEDSDISPYLKKAIDDMAILLPDDLYKGIWLPVVSEYKNDFLANLQTRSDNGEIARLRFVYLLKYLAHFGNCCGLTAKLKTINSITYFLPERFRAWVRSYWFNLK